MLSDLRVDGVTPWVTSETQDLAPQAAIAAGSAWSYELPAQSVTTFIGRIG